MGLSEVDRVHSVSPLPMSCVLGSALFRIHRSGTTGQTFAVDVAVLRSGGRIPRYVPRGTSQDWNRSVFPEPRNYDGLQTRIATVVDPISYRQGLMYCPIPRSPNDSYCLPEWISVLVRSDIQLHLDDTALKLPVNDRPIQRSLNRCPRELITDACGVVSGMFHVEQLRLVG